MYKIQSVIFDKKKFSLHLSKEWLKKHGYKDKGVDDTDHFFRFRQLTPASLKKQGYVEFRTKKLGKSGAEIIIAYKNIKDGGKISNDDLHHFIHSSYHKGASYKDWNIDPSLSDASVQVYWNGKDAVVVHRGSQDAQDWKENTLTALGIKHGLSRLEHSRKIQKEAEHKYGASNVITIGHSKGAQHAEEVGQNSREIYTLNKPVTPYDLLYKKVPEKQTDIKTTFDPVSILRPLQQGNEYQNIISKTLNPLTEHLGSVLGRINPNKWWGKGLNRKEVLGNYQSVLTHLTSHIGDPNEPIDPRDFKQSKKMINAIQKVKSGGRCWKGYEPVPGRKPYSKGSCRRIKTGGGIIRTEAQYKLAVSKLKRLLSERNLLDEEKDDLEETFNDVKNFYKENGDDLNFPDAMKFKVVLDLMIKKRIMTKQAKGLLSEYFAEEEEERYSSDFETFDEKTGKGRKTGAGAGASAYHLEEKEDDIPPHPEPVEQIPSNMPAQIADLIDYLADLNKILNQKRRNLNREDREFIEMILEKIKLLFQRNDFPDFLEDKCRRIFKVLLKRNGLGNQLGEAIDEILQLIPNLEGGGALSGGSFWSRLINILRPRNRVYIDERSSREIYTDASNEVANFQRQPNGYFHHRDVKKIEDMLDEYRTSFQSSTPTDKYLLFSFIRDNILNNDGFTPRFREELNNWVEMMRETGRIPEDSRGGNEDLTPREDINISGRGRELGLSYY